MEINDYQKWTEKTALYPKEASLLYTTLGLVGEAGEVANVVKKVLRDDNNVMTEEKRNKIIAEMGDVMWYMARLAETIGVPMTEVLQLNKEKLESRLERNVISGSGDNR